MATLKTIADHISDICENAVASQSEKCELYIEEDKTNFKFIIKDYGKGMDEDDIKKALDPFFTTKKERKKKFGVGLPFLKFSTELTGGYLKLQSKKGEGTIVEALFNKTNIDCQPVGDISMCIFSVIYISPKVDWYIKRTFNNESYDLNTEKLKELYGNSYFIPSFMNEIKEMLKTLETEIKEEN